MKFNPFSPDQTAAAPESSPTVDAEKARVKELLGLKAALPFKFHSQVDELVVAGGVPVRREGRLVR